ncbi:MAG: MFS transporter [Spirochaetales bacterium]
MARTLDVSASPRRRAMADYYRFSIFNVISFTFLAGNIIVLYSLRLGANSVLVGVIAASYQITFVFSLIGRRLIERFGAVRLFGYFWLARYVLMLPVLLTGLPALWDRPGPALAIVTVCAFAFNVSKGIGITGTKPIVGEISLQRERGAFLSNHHLIIQIGAIATGITMALVLGRESAVGRYILLLALGIAAGLGASFFILRLPEPAEAGAAFGAKFTEGFKKALLPGTFRRLAIANAIAVFAIAMGQAFLVVYFKRVYGFADGTVVFFTVAGAVGGAAMALVSRSFMDRLGSKPLLFIFAAAIGLVYVPLAIAPTLSGFWVGLFPALAYFFFVMGHTGSMNAADNYFFTVVPPEDRLDLGIVFGLGTGIAGSLGSFLGGVLLGGLESVFPGTASTPFTFYFAVAGLIVAMALFVIARLPDRGAYPIPSAIGMLFSPRDIRAIRLLNRLKRSKTADEEQQAVSALRDSTSRLPVGELSERVASPSLFVRMEAISSLRNTPLTLQAEDLLIAELRNHRFTTAHLAAEILGTAGVKRAIEPLREALDSTDYMTLAKAMVALARLGDTESLRRIELILDRSPNPRITIYAVKALELFGNPRSLPLIFAKLERRVETVVRDELILSAANLIGMFAFFYPLYVDFLEDPKQAYLLLHELANRRRGGTAKSPSSQSEATWSLVQSAVAVLDAQPGAFAGRAAAAFAEILYEIDGVDVAPYFVDALRSRRSGTLERFRVFAAAALIFVLERHPENGPPTDQLKTSIGRHR